MASSRLIQSMQAANEQQRTIRGAAFAAGLLGRTLRAVDDLRATFDAIARFRRVQRRRRAGEVGDFIPDRPQLAPRLALARQSTQAFVEAAASLPQIASQTSSSLVERQAFGEWIARENQLTQDSPLGGLVGTD